MPFYEKLSETFHAENKRKTTEQTDFAVIAKERLQGFRKDGESVVRLEKPTNLAAARSKGYKAKQGVVVARVRMRKGRGGHSRPSRGRRPKRMGVNRLTRRQSIQVMAEQRAARKFKNTQVLNSYWIGEDGKHKYFEVILIDGTHPSILADKNLSWVGDPTHKGRVSRGKTAAGKKSRGVGRGKRGRGFEKNYPSQRAHARRAK